MAAAKYRALVDIDYPPNKHVAAGDVTDDLPGKSIRWLLEQDLIQKADEDPKPLVHVFRPDDEFQPGYQPSLEPAAEAVTEPEPTPAPDAGEGDA